MFIDARNMGTLINRRTRVLTEKDITKIAETYHMWQATPSPNLSQRERNKPNSFKSERNQSNSTYFEPSPNLSQRERNKNSSTEQVGYTDIKGFCKSATIEEIGKLDYVLTPGRYVGLPDDEDEFDFNERFAKLKTEFVEQLKEEKELNKIILKNLEKIEAVR